MNEKFDCVAFQRKIRDKFVKEAGMDLNALYDLIKEKQKKSSVDKKLMQKISDDSQTISSQDKYL